MEKQILELNLSQIIKELQQLSKNSSEEVLLVIITAIILLLVLIQRIYHCYAAFRNPRVHNIDSIQDASIKVV